MSVSTQLNRVLSCTGLPSLPGVGLKVLELTRNPSVRVEEIAKVVETDAALSAKVLKTINSSLFGLQTPCTTIRRALGYLGLNAVKSIVLGFSLIESAKGMNEGPGFDMNEHWRRAIYAAAGARTIAQTTRTGDSDEAFTAALFQDLGSLAMYVALKDEYVRAIQPATDDHSRHAELEQAALGLTHMDAGAALAGKWRLPDRYVQVIRFHHDPDPAPADVRDLVRVAALGTAAALTLTSQAPAQNLARLLALAQSWFGMNESQIEAILDETAKNAREVAKLFEKSIGQPPDIASIMEQANEELVASQIASQREAEDLRSRNNVLAHQAETDGLTGLNNRKKFDEESRRLFEESTSLCRPFALLMLDGDRFKSVNDTHGHHVGDLVLKELAARITKTAGAKAVSCRYGGEEFAVLVPGATPAESGALAEQIRAAIQTPAFTFPGTQNAPKELNITVSIGVSLNDPGAGRVFPTLIAMIETADRSLYQAKKAGRNRVCFEPQIVAPVPTGSAPANEPPDNATAARTSPSATGSAPERSPAGGHASPTRLLLVEDDALSAKLMTMLLQKSAGLVVEWISDGQAAVKRLTDCVADPDTRPHVIICDLQLGAFDGRTILKFARSRPALARIPFVVLSATVQADAAAECTAAGATLVLSKSEIAQNLPKWIAKIGGELGALGRAA